MAFVGGFGVELRGMRRSAVCLRAPRSSGRSISRVQMAAKTEIQPEKEDVLLAQLRYSEPNKLPNLVQFNKDDLDTAFFAYMDKKIEEQTDDEEKENLGFLKEAILDILKHVKDIPASEQTVDVPAELKMTREESYDNFLQDVLNYEAGLKAAVDEYYARMDKDFLQMLADKADSDARIAELISHVNNKMRINVEEAQENLKMVLKSPNRGVMMDNLEKLKAKKKLDDAFLLLLQGNIEAATNANATDAVRFLTDVQREATNILDEDQAPEMQLLRRLLREGAKEARRALLVDAFAPTKSIAIDEETMTTGSAVDGKEFVTTISKLILNFGNMKEDFQQKIRMIAEESEEIAREMCGLKDKDVKQLQDEALSKRTISVFELEQIEMQSELSGGQAPWDKSENPAGFDDQGKRLI